MARKSFNPGTLLVPLPAVMATVGDMENANIITIGWTGILSSDPPRTYISVRPSRYSHKLLMENPEFVINLTTAEMVRKVDYCGIYTGRKVDKFQKCGFTKEAASAVAAPLIGESPLSLECRVTDMTDLGTHVMLLADILATDVDETLVDADGKLNLSRAHLAAYAHGEYFALGKKIGSFGFSAKKKKKPVKKGK